MRYAIANLLYRLRLPSGSLRATDFRPHFQGHLINVWVPIPTGIEMSEVEAALSQRLRRSFNWMRFLRFLLKKGDKVQFCLGTHEPLQQFMKAWSTKDDLASGLPPQVAEYWMEATVRSPNSLTL